MAIFVLVMLCLCGVLSSTVVIGCIVSKDNEEYLLFISIIFTALLVLSIIFQSLSL